MFDSVQNNTWLFFRLLLFEFLFFMNHLSRCYSLKNFKDLHMFFKELCMFYTVQLSMFICCAYLFCLRQLCYNIMCCFLCQQLFSTFFDFVFALSTKALKTHQYFVDLLLPCSATLVNIHPSSTKVNNIFQTFFKKAF